MLATQAVSMAFSLATALLFTVVAVVVVRRDVSGSLRGANRAFATWWGALALAALIGGLLMAAAVLGVRSLPLFIYANFFLVGLICLALWGLLYYLLVLMLGIRYLGVLLGVAYAALAIYLGSYILQGNPQAVELGAWRVTLTPEPTPSALQAGLLVVLIIIPEFLAALAYLGLAFRVQDGVARARIVIVGTSLLIWLGSSLLTALLGAGRTEIAEWASRILGLAAAGAILYAFVGLNPRAIAVEESAAPPSPPTPPAPPLNPRPPQLQPVMAGGWPATVAS